MPRTRFSSLFAILLFAVALLPQPSNAVAQTLTASQAGWTDLFDGTSLSGWVQKNGTATFEVHEGTILGRTKKGSPNSFLFTEKQYSDFQLSFDVKVDEGLNSGVQIRSHSKADFKKGRVHGPQVEIEWSPAIDDSENKASMGEAGFIYSEGTGRGWLSKKRTIHRHFNNTGWNHYLVAASGPRIQTWINGKHVSDLTDDQSYQKGHIGLQVHGIPANAGPFQVQWKNIRIRELEPAPSMTDKVTHSFLGLGKANKAVIVGERGKVKWKSDYPASDGWVLENGNVLLAVYPCESFPKGGVAEINRTTNKTVFQFQGTQSEISTVEPLADGQFLIAELGKNPRAIIVNREGRITRETPFQCQKQNAHMQTRMLRQLPNGNLLAPHLLDFAVREYELTGKVINSFATDDRGRDKHDWPFTAIRLKSGNTLVGCTHGNRVIELDPDGKIVWSISNEDLDKPMIRDACGIQRLPNGNTVISSYAAKGQQVKLFEVTPDKKVVWEYRDMPAGFHHFQILTTNGKPQTNNRMK